MPLPRTLRLSRSLGDYLRKTLQILTVLARLVLQLLVLKKKDYDRKIRPLHEKMERERIGEFRILAAFSQWDEDKLVRLSSVHLTTPPHIFAHFAPTAACLECRDFPCDV